MDDVEEERKASICLRGLCGSWKMLDGLPSMARQRTSLHQSVASNQGARVIVSCCWSHHTRRVKGINNSQSQVEKKKKMVVKKRVATAVEKDTRIIRSAITGKRG